MDYLQKFKEKCKVNDIFMDKVNFLFERLLHFGYVDKLNISRLEKKLYNNIILYMLVQMKLRIIRLVIMMQLLKNYTLKT